MKRIIVLLMCLMLCVTAVACAEEPAAPALTDSVLDGAIEINGVVYQMPMPVQKLLDNGWEFSNENGTIKHNQVVTTRVKQNDFELSIKIANLSGSDMSFADAPVVAITFHVFDGDLEKVSAKFSNAVSLESDVKAIEDAQGEPDEKEGGGLFSGGDARLVYKGPYTRYFNVGHKFAVVFKGGKLSEVDVYYMPDDFQH